MEGNAYSVLKCIVLFRGNVCCKFQTAQECKEQIYCLKKLQMRAEGSKLMLYPVTRCIFCHIVMSIMILPENTHIRMRIQNPTILRKSLQGCLNMEEFFCLFLMKNRIKYAAYGTYAHVER